MTIRWIGPSGKIVIDSNKSLVNLFQHNVLRRNFSEGDLKELKSSTVSALTYLRELYSRKKLNSLYHNLGHNYVTSITAVKVFIGALRQGYAFFYTDLLALILAALFHDSGYLGKPLSGQKISIENHTENATLFAEDFAQRSSIEKDISRQVIKLIKYTNYSRWDDYKFEVEIDLLAQVLIGADLLQVTDKRYFFNKKVLSEYLFVDGSGPDKVSQRKFYRFAKKMTSSVWKHLDAFYNGTDKNPYREGWKRFMYGLGMVTGTRSI